MVKQQKKIAVMLGGTSPEREVSKQSGKAIYNALLSLGYDVKLIDPAYGKNQPVNIEDYFAEKDYTGISNQNVIETVNSGLLDNIDLVVIALHGKYGEDGTVQSLLDLKGVKYTGSGVLPSALSMNKATSKILFQHFDVKTPQWFVVNDKNKDASSVVKRIEEYFGFPCILKPNDQGSTIGLSICRTRDEIQGALSLAFKFSDTVLVEEFIPGRELAVGIIGSHVLPVLEIIPKHELYDYECKYTDGMSEYVVPAKLPADVTGQLQQQAMLAFNALGCTNYGRVDFRLDENYYSYCLEVNTLPGMTSHSLVPKMAEAEGKSFEELVEQLILTAL